MEPCVDIFPSGRRKEHKKMLIWRQFEVFVSVFVAVKCVRQHVCGCVGVLWDVALRRCVCVSEVLIKEQAAWLQLLIFEADF